MTKEIYAPSEGETVQIGQHTNSYSLSLSDDLLASIKMSRVSAALSATDPHSRIPLQFEDNEVGYVSGRISNLASSTIPVLEPASHVPAASAQQPGEPARGRMLGARPTQPLPQSTMIGELKLTALKARLADVGVQAELVGEGVLICGAGARHRAAAAAAGGDALGDSVAVRKTARGKVEVEGSVSDVYYVVRREIYGLLALVAA